MQIVNDLAPWWGMTPGGSLSIVDLIENGTIPAEGAAALWWALERGASAFVAAAPRLAGKTTMATALFSFLPDDARGYITAGPRDPITPPAGPGPLYLLINELSDHTPVYLAGPAALRAFALLRDGARVIGTLHADSAEEAVAVMHQQAGIPLGDVARVNLVLVLRARRTATDVERRAVEIGLLRPRRGDVTVETIAGWDTGAGRMALTDSGVAALAAWAGLPASRARTAISERADALVDMTRHSMHAPRQVTEAVRAFRSAQRTGHATT